MLKNKKIIPHVCDVTNSNKDFHQFVKNVQFSGSLLLQIKIKQKQKLINLLFQGENNSTIFIKQAWP